MGGVVRSMRRTSILACTCCAVAAAGPFPPYQVEITKVLHTGDPAPGIAGATISYLAQPQIDGAGNVLVDPSITGPGVNAGNNLVIYYGPPGGLQIVIREGDPAPDLPSGVVIASLFGGNQLCEAGTIWVFSQVSGPGITPGVNDTVNYVGPPGALQKIFQSGDPAPQTEPGTIFAGGSIMLSDNGSILVRANLAGPMVNSTNDQAMYVGYPDNPQLLWRKGMQAPGTEPGTVFAWVDDVKFNDLHHVGFRAGVTGPGVNQSNDAGYWAGGLGALLLLARRGSGMPGAPEGAYVLSPGSFSGFSGSTDIAFAAQLAGRGVTVQDDIGTWAGPANDFDLVFREGFPLPDLPPDVTLAVGVSGPLVTAAHHLWGIAFLQGPGVDVSNDRAIYFGPIDSPHLIMRSGDDAPTFADGVYVSVTTTGNMSPALNDIGGHAFKTRLTGTGISAANDTVVWYRQPQTGAVLRVAQTGRLVDGLPVSQFDWIGKTGGSDGELQSFNDAGKLAARLDFSDGSKGVYVLFAHLAGDVDSDGDVDLLDSAELQSCFAAITAVDADCAAADPSGDGLVDLEDIAMFALALTGP